MKLFEISTQRSIVLVCGNLCSGKGHFCETKYPDYTRIGISDIVRELSKAKDRQEMSKTGFLDMMIVAKLIPMISQHDKVIVDGIRQLSILHALENHFGQQIKDVIWLEVPHETLRARYEQRASAKDKAFTFDQALKSDQDLGIGDVEDYIKRKHRSINYSN